MEELRSDTSAAVCCYILLSRETTFFFLRRRLPPQINNRRRAPEMTIRGIASNLGVLERGERAVGIPSGTVTKLNGCLQTSRNAADRKM